MLKVLYAQFQPASGDELASWLQAQRAEELHLSTAQCDALLQTLQASTALMPPSFQGAPPMRDFASARVGYLRRLTRKT